MTLLVFPRNWERDIRNRAGLVCYLPTAYMRAM